MADGTFQGTLLVPVLNTYTIQLTIPENYSTRMATQTEQSINYGVTSVSQAVKDAAYRAMQATFKIRSKPDRSLGKRHKTKKNLAEISKPGLRRLSRRGGVKRLSADIYNSTRDAMNTFLDVILFDSIAYMEHAKRKTIIAMDVLLALKRRGRTLYVTTDHCTWNAKKPEKK